MVHNNRCFCNGKCAGRFPPGLDIIDLDAALHGDSTTWHLLAAGLLGKDETGLTVNSELVKSGNPKADNPLGHPSKSQENYNILVCSVQKL